MARAAALFALIIVGFLLAGGTLDYIEWLYEHHAPTRMGERAKLGTMALVFGLMFTCIALGALLWHDGERKK